MTDPKHTEPVDLLPCPFCGGEAELHENTSGQAQGFVPVFNPGCKACDVRSPDWYGTEAEAIAVWNTRTAAEAASRAMIIQLGENAAKAAKEYTDNMAASREREARLREALERIAGQHGPYSHPFPEGGEGYAAWAVMEARAALTASEAPDA